MQGLTRAPQQERSRRRVEAILDAAAAEFAERGFARATTASVAARAGVPIGSLYQWFTDKEALLHGVAERHLDDASTALLAAVEEAQGAPSLDASIRIVVEAAVAANSGDPRVHRLLYREAPRPPALQARLADLQDELVAWVAGELVRRGARKAGSSQLRARTLVLAVEALVHDLVLDPPPRVSRRAATDEVVAAAVAIATA